MTLFTDRVSRGGNSPFYIFRNIKQNIPKSGKNCINELIHNNMQKQKEEILYGTIIVADEQVVKGKGANIRIKRKVEQAIFKPSDTHWKGLQILSVVESKVVGYTNRPN